MNNKINIKEARITQEQALEFSRNFEPNGKDNIFVNSENPTLYVSALLDYIFSNSTITYKKESKEFDILFNTEKESHSATFKESDLADTFNTFTSQLFKMCAYRGNQFTYELLTHLRW